MGGGMKEDVIKLARRAGPVRTGDQWVEPARWGITEIERFYQLAVAAEREKVAAWMIDRSYATGHGDTIEDLLKELEWQVAERERDRIIAANAPEIERVNTYIKELEEAMPPKILRAIRARGQE